MSKRNIAQKRKKKTRKRGSTQSLVPNRVYKARLFEMIFSQKEKLLELYNAMNGSHYTNPEDLQINTLENAIYITMKNDVSFIIDSRLNLYEHQSTYNPNLPLRFLMYTSDIYSGYTKDANLYGHKPIKLPNPCFVVFYNGAEDRPDREVLLLSDLYEISKAEVNLQLKAVVLNINPGHNPELLSICKTLRDFSTYCDLVRTYAQTMDLDVAVERAITECIHKDILSDFLKKNRTEAKAVSIYEFDEKKYAEHLREEGRAEGRAEGKIEGRIEGRIEGKIEERLENVQNLHASLNLPYSQIMDLLKIPESDRESLLEKLTSISTQ